MNVLTKQLYRSFTEHAEKTCLIIGSESYAYDEVYTVAAQIRSVLLGIQSQNIGLYLTDDLHMYAAILAIWFEGKTYVPVHPQFPESKNRSVIEQAEISIILSSVNVTQNLGAEVIDTFGIQKEISEEPVNITAETNAYILFTSGSTGQPKGVPITHSNLFWFADGFSSTFGKLNPDDHVLQMFELTFDLSVMSYLIPWLYGAAVVALHKEEAKYLQILDLLEANEITVALMVPSILNLIIPYLDPQINNESLRLNLFCGEALLQSQVEKWQNFVPAAELYNVYGPTENTIFCTAHKIKKPYKEKNGIISIGRQMKNTELQLKDGETQGELLLSGKLLAKSYWQNPAKTAEAFIELEGHCYYRTGDWCEKDEDGDYFYLNRIDFQAKINGFRIELAEIEYFANQKLENAVSVAVVKKDGDGNDYLVLFVNDMNCNVMEMISHLKKNLPDYAVPSKIITLPQFPENSSGKTDRNELKKLLK